MNHSQTALVSSDEEYDGVPEYPGPEDIVLQPAPPLGSRTSVSVVEGAFLGEFSSDSDAAQAALDYMEKTRFCPNVWYVNDHGNADIINPREYL